MAKPPPSKPVPTQQPKKPGVPPQAPPKPGPTRPINPPRPTS